MKSNKPRLFSIRSSKTLVYSQWYPEKIEHYTILSEQSYLVIIVLENSCSIELQK